jgi:Mg2+/Co2+ transporter CorB
MKEIDIEKLGSPQKQVLERSFQAALTEKRARNVLLSAFMTLSGLALFSVYGVGLFAITAMSVVIVVVSAVEKVTYAREILVYKALVRNLVNKVEELQGIELTPRDSHPAARARLRARKDEALAQSGA